MDDLLQRCLDAMSTEPEGEDDTPASITKRVADVLKEDEYYKILNDVTDPYKLTEDERYKYERVLRNYRDLLNILVGHWEIGFAKGFVGSLDSYREEDKAKVAIHAAKYLKERGFAHSIISDSTGLSYEEIKKL